ncbi:hypothetical protein [Cohaesibacter gelatinilyticus]|uniref:Uncharacterized protein n=1 Tax=Cohaesibacter gelatinilyticus TaxID=372072 RepID=A0A285PGW5_9HYPH|nr:hypothetical protein [Cohaesibacter gelatinilyticus]SNZ20959.1 hypothetical protein SAMN06265368_4073 [Cohaesibacter gelatinilyticus]
MIRRYILNILIAIDQLFSAIAFGDPDETISSRLGKSQRGDHGPFWKHVWWPVRLTVDGLFYLVGEPNHCIRSIEKDEGQNAIL